MSWNRVKKMFKKKQVVKDVPVDFDMMLKSRCLKEGLYEVGGVVISADTHAEAVRKYRRAKNEDG